MSKEERLRVEEGIELVELGGETKGEGLELAKLGGEAAGWRGVRTS